MEEVVKRNQAGELSCPRCDSPLTRKNAPFSLHSEYIGNFESLVCEICNYSALTAKGYDDAMEEARKFGMVGPLEEIIKETIEPISTHLVIYEMFFQDTFDQKLKLTKADEESEAESFNVVGKFQVPIHYETKSNSKLTQVLIRQ